MTAFAFDQVTPRGADHCAMRRPFGEVELRARLRLLPIAKAAPRPLDAELGCPAPPAWATPVTPQPAPAPARPGG